MKKKSINILILCIVLIATFFTSMSVCYMIPNNRIRWHVQESVEQFKNEGQYPRLFFGTPAAQLDNFTDAWMLNIALSADNDNPIKSSLRNDYMSSDGDKVQMLEKAAYNPDDTILGSYSRYWHGYLVFLRPLLLVFNYSEIRFLNMCMLFLLFTIVNILIKKKLGTRVMVGFLFTMMLVMFMIVPMSIQFSSMFYIMFIAMIVVLTLYEKIDKENLSAYVFFIIGAVASFLDLLTVPLITIGIPMAVYIMLRNKRTALENFLEVIKGSIIWALGYGLTWGSKWVIATIVLKENVIKNAIHQILVRTSDTGNDVTYTAIDTIKNNANMIFNDLTIKIFVALIVIWLISLIFFGSRRSIIKATPLLLIACMPIVWYVVLKNHSSIHFWFTYRSLAVSVFGVLAFMDGCLDKDKIMYKLGGYHWNI